MRSVPSSTLGAQNEELTSPSSFAAAAWPGRSRDPEGRAAGPGSVWSRALRSCSCVVSRSELAACRPLRETPVCCTSPAWALRGSSPSPSASVLDNSHRRTRVPVAVPRRWGFPTGPSSGRRQDEGSAVRHRFFVWTGIFRVGDPLPDVRFPACLTRGEPWTTGVLPAMRRQLGSVTVGGGASGLPPCDTPACVGALRTPDRRRKSL